MLSKRQIYFISGIIIMLFSACAQRNLVYFSDLSQTSVSKNLSALLANSENKIQPYDVLNINVTSLSPESNNLFNLYNSNNSNNNNPNLPKEGYRVDKEGFVNFPVLGKIQLGGLTTDQAEQKIVTELGNYVKKPIVNIDFLNFKVTVIGEVNRPGTFNVTGENISLLEALGLAGDMTPYGKRNNVLIVRQIDGRRNITRINLNKSEVFDSPYYYLKQNDVVYVEPDKSKEQQTNQNNRFIPIISASFSVIAVLLSVFLRK